MAELPILLFRCKNIEQGKLLYPKICPLISQGITLDPQVSFQALNYKFSKKITHKGKMVIYILKSQTLTFGLKKVKFQKKSYFIKTCWNMKFVSSRSPKVKFYFGKVKFLNTWNFSKCLRIMTISEFLTRLSP